MFGGCVIAAGVLGGIPAALGALGAFLSSRLFRYSETRIIAKEPPSLRNTPNPPLPAKPPIVSPIQKIETPVKIDEEEFEEVEIPAEDLYCADAERDAVETGAMVLGERLLGLRAKIAFGLKPEEEQRRIAKEMLARFYAKVRFEHPELDPTSVEILVHARKKVEFFLLQLPTLSNKEMEQLLKQEGLFPEI
jgi:hypothetical protein